MPLVELDFSGLLLGHWTQYKVIIINVGSAWRKCNPSKLEDHLVGRTDDFKQLFHTGEGRTATTCAEVPKAL